MDWSKLPPLNSLRAFFAVAESGSLRLAAEQLNVTHAAVSQQLKSLEKRMQVSLVERTGRGTRLTNEGEIFARHLDKGFRAFEQGVDRLSESAITRPVQVTMSPAFAVEWLMPRIAEFQSDNPKITLLLNPTSKMVDLNSSEFDVAIRYRDKRRLQDGLEPVLVSDMIVLGAPSLLDGYDAFDPASLAKLPWLQELGTNEVADWFTYHGVVLDRPLRISHMPGNLIMDAVRRGDGITYTARAFFRQDLAEGSVIELHSEPLFGVYYVQTPQERRRPAVKTFLHWLMTNAETVSG
jgi:LysR family transcriptional regulator, glycine cleavage system transcriptional activator